MTSTPPNGKRLTIAERNFPSGSFWDQAKLEGACDARRILDLIADKWSLFVIALLGDRRRRFSELKREIDGISQRMLTLTLRQLEREGLVTRTVFPVVPPRVEYELTKLGETLLETAQSLLQWSIDNREEIAAARVRYDKLHAVSVD